MRKAQSMLEYTILLMIIIAAFLAMQVYLKRGFQGRWKQAADGLGDQYDMSAFDSNVRTTLNTTTQSTVKAMYGVTYNNTSGMLTYRNDSTTTVETKNGASHLAAAPL